MATAKQKAAARQNVKKAQAARAGGSPGGSGTTAGGRTSSARRASIDESQFAFPEQRKEPLTDARHVRNAIARFDQVEGVSDADREKAWRRIKAAAREHAVDVAAGSWRELMKGGKSG